MEKGDMLLENSQIFRKQSNAVLDNWKCAFKISQWNGYL